MCVCVHVCVCECMCVCVSEIVKYNVRPRTIPHDAHAYIILLGKC